jgi:hypothetical protein
MKNYIRQSYASGSTWRKVFEIVNQCGKYSPKKIAKRETATRRRKGENEF